MNIVFMGTPAFAVPSLQILLDSHHHVQAVYTQPPRPAGRGHKEQRSPIHELAEQHNIPVHTPAKLKDPELQQEFIDLKADIAVVAAYGLLLPTNILDAYPHGCINLHPSLLPRWRGAAPIQRAVLAGDMQTGAGIMYVAEELDSGDLIAEVKHPISQKDTSGTLHDILAEKGAKLILETVNKFADGTATSTPQSEEGVTYAHKINKEEALIDWNQPPDTIDCLIRGMAPWPGARFEHEDVAIKVLEAEISHEDPQATPGTVLDDSLTIACKGGSIRPLLCQRPGKKAMSTEELLRGYSIPKGEKL